MTGSSATPRSRARSLTSSSAMRTPGGRRRPRPARSFISVVMATAQPLPRAADDVLVGNARLLDEELVELRLIRDLVQRADLHLVLLHVHDEVGQALVLRRVRVGARHEHAPLGLVGEGGPDLLPVTTHSPFDLTALVLSEARSEPDSGSENPCTRSRRRSGSAEASAPSARPCRGASPRGRPSPGRARSRARARAPRHLLPNSACSTSVAPRPPYSLGQARPAYPAS